MKFSRADRSRLAEWWFTVDHVLLYAILIVVAAGLVLSIAASPAVAERRARQLAGLDRQTAERRLSAFLQRRGYPGEMVREVVTAALSAEGS